MTAEGVVMQHLDDLAGGDPAAGAFGRHARQLRLERLKLGDLLGDVAQMALGDRIGLAASPVGMIRQVEQGLDRADVEPQLERVVDYGEAAGAEPSYRRRSLAVRDGVGN